jgi:hypothetical protein
VTKSKHHLKQQETGSAMLELSAVMVLFLAILGAIFDLSFMFFHRASNLHLATSVARAISKLPAGQLAMSVVVLKNQVEALAEQAIADKITNFQEVGSVSATIWCPDHEGYPENLANGLHVPFLELEYRLTSACLLCWDNSFRRELKSKTTLF